MIIKHHSHPCRVFPSVVFDHQGHLRRSRVCWWEFTIDILWKVMWFYIPFPSNTLFPIFYKYSSPLKCCQWMATFNLFLAFHPLLSINNACLWQVIGLHLMVVKQEYGCQSTQSVCHRPVRAEISWWSRWWLSIVRSRLGYVYIHRSSHQCTLHMLPTRVLWSVPSPPFYPMDPKPGVATREW